ncbi:MAG: hypothetical protein H8E21_09025 [Gammaproteobacteria bacterium]|nr:hypothetical protein [Gammaproteobacteria bacterium]
MNEQEFFHFIDRSIAFQAEVGGNVSRLVPVPEVRFMVAFQSGLIALEHSTAVLQLIRSGLFASGFCLFRPQFESLVRGIWLLYAATDKTLENLAQPLSEESVSKANDVPMLSKMLEKLEKSEAPAAIVAQLQQYKEATWKSMNSYAHGGIHPLARTLSGYPAQLTYEAMRNSNAVTALTAQLMAILTGDPDNMVSVRTLHSDFIDCLPIAAS